MASSRKPRQPATPAWQKPVTGRVRIVTIQGYKQGPMVKEGGRVAAQNAAALKMLLDAPYSAKEKALQGSAKREAFLARVAQATGAKNLKRKFSFKDVA